jgi:hypothetical protein
MLQLFVILSSIIMAFSQSFAEFEHMSMINYNGVNSYNNALYVDYYNNDDDDVEVEVDVEIEVQVQEEVEVDVDVVV